MSTSEKIDDGGPAFPTAYKYTDRSGAIRLERNGASLRDWFAGHALTGLMSIDRPHTFDEDARRAYAAADAMIAERAKARGDQP